MKKQIVVAMGLILLFADLVFATEQITLTTYYPSPFGAYDRVRLVPRAETGIVCNTNNVGLMYYDIDFKTLRICRDDGFNNIEWTSTEGPWDMQGNNIFPKDTEINDNIAVGIGTINPISPLHLTSPALVNLNNQSQFYQYAEFAQSVLPMRNYGHRMVVQTNQAYSTNQFSFGLYVDMDPGASEKEVPCGTDGCQSSESSSEVGVWSRADSYGVYGLGHTGIFGDGSSYTSGTGVVGYQTENDGFAMRAIMGGNNPAFQVEANGILADPLVRFQHRTSAFSGTGLLMDFAEGTGSFTGNFLDFQKNNATQLIVKNNGNLGIQRSSPIAKLEVANTGTEDILKLFDGATEVVTVQDGGNVGIGTNAPAAKLHVAGSAQFDGNVSFLTGIMSLGETKGTLPTDTVPKGSTGGWLVDSGETYVNIQDNLVVRQDAVFSDDIFVLDKVDAAQIYTKSLNVNGHEIVKNLMADALQMASGARVTAGGVWVDASSRDLKENVQSLSLSDALNVLKGLNPVTYNYKVDKDEQYVGFIAEDVPALVAQSDRRNLSPMDLVAVLTRVVQDQQKEIEILKKKIFELDSR